MRPLQNARREFGARITQAPRLAYGQKVKGKVRTADALSRTASLGRIEVSPRVVASIVAHAANESYGIVGMAARGMRDGIAERLNRDSAHRGVQVQVRPGGIVVELYVIVEYGTRISEVAHNLISAVRYHLERTLGLRVLEVNVNVQGIHTEQDGARF